MKTLIILVLALLVFGLYYYTAETKEVLQTTGNVVKPVVSGVLNEGKEFVEEEMREQTTNKES